MEETFSILDGALFALMLALSAFIGIYFGFYKKQNNTLDYIFGGKKLGALPVAASLIVSYTSGTTFMGVPSDVYQNGSFYAVSALSLIVATTIVHYTFLPVFYKLQLTSNYEYLKLRFGTSVRFLGSFLFTISMVLMMPIIIYAPSLAFNQVTGASIYVIIPIVSGVCIFYTMTGGLKAVVWTDFLQGIVMFGSFITVIYLGIADVGGLEIMFQRASDGGRIKFFELDPNPTTRDTFWTLFIGNIVLITRMIGVLQGSVQRFIATPTMRSARVSLWLFCFGDIIMVLLSVLTGLMIYAKYYDCDPVKLGEVARYDQLIIHFVMSTAKSVRGVAGLFIAGIFSAALSTISSNLNSLAATIFEDFVSPCLYLRPSEEKVNKIMKGIVFMLGMLSLFLTFVIEYLGDLLELTYSAVSITGGTITGLFALGMFFPHANTQGALAGGVSSVCLVGWMVFGANAQKAAGKIRNPSLPTSVEGCTGNFTQEALERIIISLSQELGRKPEEAFYLYRISYWYYALIGMLIVLVIGMVVSIITGVNDPHRANPALFVSMVANRLRKNERNGNNNSQNLPF